jgi:hypothetical protein
MNVIWEPTADVGVSVITGSSVEDGVSVTASIVGVTASISEAVAVLPLSGMTAVMTGVRDDAPGTGAQATSCITNTINMLIENLCLIFSPFRL